MTTPDYPDWSPGTVDVAAGVTVFNNSAMLAAGFNTGALDTRTLNSVNIWVDSADNSALNPIAIEAVWQVGSTSVGTDYCTVGNGFISNPVVRQSVITLPCKGDTLSIQGASAATLATVGMTVTGSARTVPGLRASVPGQNNGSVLATNSGPAIPAGGSVTLYYGPVSGAVNIGLSGDVKTFVRAFTWQLVAGAWGLVAIGPQLFATAAGVAQTVQCPGRLCSVIINNSDTVAHAASCWVTDAG